MQNKEDGWQWLQEFRTLFTNRSYEVNYAVKEAYD